MPRRRNLPRGILQKAFRSRPPDRASCAEEEPAALQAVDIDALSASPWIGLHYRHEFLLHYRHELLVQRHED
jgi:hypothetical protein